MFAAALAVALLASPTGRLLWQGESYGLQIELREHSLIARAGGGRNDLELCRFAPPGPGCDSGAGYQLVSLVGTLLGARSRLDADCGGAHPLHADELVTVDLRDGKLVRLGDLFTPEAIRQAWEADPFVKRTAKEGSPMPLPPLEELGSFVLHHVQGGRVAVRVQIRSDEPRPRVLGLLLPIPNMLRAPLRAAASGNQGFLATKAPRVRLSCPQSPR